jgi:predicted SnoaL-like aldol condensation-catalyzing enzyme
MRSNRKDQICALLRGIETGDPSAVTVVNQDKYIQHNPQTHEGGEGLEALFKRLSKRSPRVNIVRIFEDGDYVFAHTEYDFATSNIGFEIFRFENEHAVEHWDNIQLRQGPSPSGHTMVDGPTEATDLSQTESNREIVRSFVDDILINRRYEKLEHYIVEGCFTQHDSRIADGLSALRSALDTASRQNVRIEYDRIHRLLAEGSFVLSVSEGSFEGAHSAFYDLFHIVEGKLVEHWDTIEAIPSRSEWKNENGKF